MYTYNWVINMNKKEFIKFLEEKLFYLVEPEREKEINKYSDVIDSYVNMGQSEEVALSSLGNPEDLVKAIYLSHGLDYKKVVEQKSSLKGFKGAIKNFGKIIAGFDKKKARNSILYVLYLLVFVVLLKIAFIFVRDNGANFFGEIFTNSVFDKIYYALFEVAYYITAVIVFIKMFTKKFNS